MRILNGVFYFYSLYFAGDNMMTFKYMPAASKGPERLYFAGDKAVSSANMRCEMAMPNILGKVLL